ncbi:MAG: 2-C-methyl-D-erythritol 2,4-cyclodiphosphate synthase [Planctomycetes bacterium]|nr:2-C-methyl-D-erythritol 2,4-cyclodiphosphate synthase [Planctomycetota bacterium]
MNFRVGIGTDLHKFDSNSPKPLVIGGIQIPSEQGILAHSDGDVLIHAIIDALLGASVKGDIGELFPDNDSANKDKNSEFFLLEVAKMLQKLNYAIVNLDCVVHLEKPKLTPYKAQIRNNIARMLKISVDAVNIKAKTREKLDAVGKGEAIESIVIVLLSTI